MADGREGTPGDAAGAVKSSRARRRLRAERRTARAKRRTARATDAATARRRGRWGGHSIQRRTDRDRRAREGGGVLVARSAGGDVRELLPSRGVRISAEITREVAMARWWGTFIQRWIYGGCLRLLSSTRAAGSADGSWRNGPAHLEGEEKEEEVGDELRRTRRGRARRRWSGSRGERLQRCGLHGKWRLIDKSVLALLQHEGPWEHKPQATMELLMEWSLMNWDGLAVAGVGTGRARGRCPRERSGALFPLAARHPGSIPPRQLAVNVTTPRDELRVPVQLQMAARSETFRGEGERIPRLVRSPRRGAAAASFLLFLDAERASVNSSRADNRRTDGPDARLCRCAR
ncbi:unnamed protein product [Lampetra fluviatilis]